MPTTDAGTLAMRAVGCQMMRRRHNRRPGRTETAASAAACVLCAARCILGDADGCSLPHWHSAGRRGVAVRSGLLGLGLDGTR